MNEVSSYSFLRQNQSCSNDQINNELSNHRFYWRALSRVFPWVLELLLSVRIFGEIRTKLLYATEAWGSFAFPSALNFYFLFCTVLSQVERVIHRSFIKVKEISSDLAQSPPNWTQNLLFSFVFLRFSENIQYTTWSYVFLFVPCFFVNEGNNYWVDFFPVKVGRRQFVI